MMDQVYLLFHFNQRQLSIDVQVFKTLEGAERCAGQFLVQDGQPATAAQDAAHEWRLADGSYLSIQAKPVQ